MLNSFQHPSEISLGETLKTPDASGQGDKYSGRKIDMYCFFEDRFLSKNKWRPNWR
ncbi:hypothetical protein JM83_0618 [Gillisia sp. Hel_I_86]|nr:hypothetical protein JM83_0618 [Gillisia sp. Hel_I_86]